MNLFLATTALWLAGPADDHAQGHGPQLGTIAFETTCSAGAEALVNQGLGWLHSFEYEQSARTFAEAAAADTGMFDKGAVKLCHPHCAKFCVLGGGSCS